MFKNQDGRVEKWQKQRDRNTKVTCVMPPTSAGVLEKQSAQSVPNLFIVMHGNVRLNIVQGLDLQYLCALFNIKCY